MHLRACVCSCVRVVRVCAHLYIYACIVAKLSLFSLEPNYTHHNTRTKLTVG